MEDKKINPYDPFDNPTENCAYRTNYCDIEPRIKDKNYKLPLLPERSERKRIRHFFNAAGLGLLIGSVSVNIIFIIISFVLEFFMTGSFDKDKLLDAEYYMNYNSSILIALNGIMFLLVNLIPAVVGSRLTGIRVRSYFRPICIKKIQIGKYMLMGIFIQAATAILYAIVESIMQAGGINDYTADIDTYISAKSIIATALYSCIVAPITEELLYRGFVMKNLSRVSQRFGIIASAVLFGLAHENIAQFLLAVPVGIFMGRIVVKHNSIIPSIIVHISVNTMAFGMNWIYEIIPDNNIGSAVMFFTNVLYYFIAGAGMIFWIMEVRRTRLPANTIKQNCRGMRIALSSPLLVAAALLHIGMALMAIAIQN
ncbi:MAG: CPBP family intramembrane metalloprotease [Ruminococcus sp.]|nr:CPBP family intramembrane metalloprotease [Ruminococcus sp.]